jgi:precorrin-2 dehydrogenase/sirohydrochlorin ferrochelatase
VFDYPVFLQLRGKCCVVVGSGPVGMRKTRGLLAVGAKVRLISPTLEDWRCGENIEPVRRTFRAGDLDGARLVFAATGDNASDRAVAAEARRIGVPVCLAALPEEGDFSLPAILRRGDLAVAVATAGGSPALAAEVRDLLADLLPGSWSVVVDIATALRRRKPLDAGGAAYGRETLRRLLDGQLVALLEARDAANVDRLLQQVCVPSCTLAALGISLPERNP